MIARFLCDRWPSCSSTISRYKYIEILHNFCVNTSGPVYNSWHGSAAFNRAISVVGGLGEHNACAIDNSAIKWSMTKWPRDRHPCDALTLCTAYRPRDSVPKGVSRALPAFVPVRQRYPYNKAAREICRR